MSGKSKKTVIILYIVLAAMYSVIFFAVPFERNATTWVAYAFGMVSIIAGLIVAFVAFDKGDSLKSKVYGFPLIRLGYYYTAVQLILSIALFVAVFFVEIPSWISIVFSVLLLGVFVIGVVAIDNVRDIVEKNDYKDEIKTKTVETFRVDINSLVGRSGDAEVNKAIEKLAEEIRYSDPFSSEATKGIEQEIIDKINELGAAIKGNKDNTKQIISELSGMISDRNRICKANK